ncbi:MAG: putative transcriptional regulatory protein NarL [Chitinophagaceae bacterium]|nr:putative transcriptional regulatory protein NarL [Chitinophagaceae bacterium]
MKASKKTASKEKSLMIIETDTGFSNCLKSVFVSHDITVYDFSDAASFLRTGIDLLSQVQMVLLEMSLGKDDGLDLIQTIKLHNPSVSIIMLTAETDHSSIKKAFEYGVNGFLLKDEPVQEISKQIMSCFNHKQITISNKALNKLIQFVSPETKSEFNQLHLSEKALFVAEKGELLENGNYGDQHLFLYRANELFIQVVMNNAGERYESIKAL